MSTLILRRLRTTCLSHPTRLQDPLRYRPSHDKGISSYTSLPSTSISLHSFTRTQNRHATSTTKSATVPSPPPQKQKQLSSVNGPPSTLPAPLSTPTRDPSQSAFKHYLLLGKAYLQFYKTGVKNIYANFQASRPIQARIDKDYKSSLSQAAASGALTRSEFQLLARNWHDLKKLPIFALVFMICGEFTPLVVIALSGVVPWTCRIPKQIEKDRKKLEERRAISFRNLTMEPPREKGVAALQRMQLLHISWSLGLSSSFWDWLGGQLPGLPTPILRRRVGRRIEYLRIDDDLLKKCGGVKEMNAEEVEMALVERGINTLGRKDGEMKADLGSWLRSKEKAPVERLLLTRPSVWPVRTKAD